MSCRGVIECHTETLKKEVEGRKLKIMTITLCKYLVVKDHRG